MPVVEVNQPAPDFALVDFKGDIFRLSGFKGAKNVLLVLNRGFT